MTALAQLRLQQGDWGEQRQVRLAGAQVRCRVTGTGPDLVLLPDATGSGRCWGEVARALSATATVHAPDLPGGGADDVAGLLHALGLDRPVVGGWGAAGHVVLELGVRHPGLAGALVVGSPGRTPDPALRRITDPVLLVAADRDPQAPLGRATALLEQLPTARLAVLPGTGQDLVAACPDDVAWLLACELDRLGGRR